MTSPPPTKEVIDCTTGEVSTVPLTPEEIAAGEAAQAAQRSQQQSATFAVADDAERLAIIRERAETDPAFAALADLTLGSKGVQT